MDFKVAGTPGLRHRAAARHQARRHPVGRAGRRAAAGARRPADDPRRDGRGDRRRRPRCREYAPRVTTVKIPVDKIGMVIGPKGQTINAIQDETGAEISIEDDGTIYVGATDGPSAAGRGRPDQRDRQPDHAEGRRPVPRHGGEDGRVRRVRLAAARPRRPAAHLQGGRRQAGRARSRTSSTSATRSRSRSPTSTPAARSTWTRSAPRAPRRRPRATGRPAATAATAVRATAATAAATVARGDRGPGRGDRGAGAGGDGGERRRRRRRAPPAATGDR